MKKLLLGFIAIVACESYSSGQSIPSYVPATGLVGWWPFTGNALDSSGNGNHGTVNGATLTTDRNGSGNSAYSFDGVNDYILSPGGTNYINDSITISFWIYNTTNSFSNAELICIGSSSSTYYGVICSNLGTRLNYGRGCGETTQTNATSPFSLNTWNHIVIRSFAAPNQTEVYLNGTFQGYASNSNPSGCSNSNLYFGVDIFSVAEYYLGLLDDIGIWNRALSACEISKLYLASNTFFTSKPANQAVKIGASASFTIKDTLGSSASYQWQENSGAGFVNLSNTSPYSGVNTKTLDINPVVAGMHNNQYRCIRNGGSSCLDTSAAAILTLSNLSIKANQLEGLTIRPNPVHNSLNINAPATINKLVLYNTLGQLIFESYPRTKNASIDMSVYPAGMYILKLNDEWVEKMIKE